jgi:uncharacterized protein (TIGR02270 family)
VLTSQVLRRLSRPEGPLWEIVERHFEEAEFLAELWRDAFDQPDLTLAGLARGIEARLRAHLDGIAVAGPAVLDRLCWPMLEGTADLSRAWIAALVILGEGGEPDLDRLAAVLEASEVGDERWMGLVEALSLSPRRKLGSWLLAQLDGNAGPRVAGVTQALACRRTTLGSALTPLLQSDDPAVLAAAARLARAGDPAQVALLARLGHHEDHRVVAAAVENTLVRGVAGAIEVARYWAFETPACVFQAQALVWMALLGDAEDQRRLLGLFDNPEQRGRALWAAGFSGQAAAVDAALPWLSDENVGPLAGELVSGIAGLPMGEPSLWIERDRDGEGLRALVDDHLDADLSLTPEELLPVPDPNAVTAWWENRRSGFAEGQRYVSGLPLDSDSLAQALVEQPLRRRHILALLLEIRTKGAVRLATRDWAHLQLGELDDL